MSTAASLFLSVYVGRDVLIGAGSLHPSLSMVATALPIRESHTYNGSELPKWYTNPPLVPPSHHRATFEREGGALPTWREKEFDRIKGIKRAYEPDGRRSRLLLAIGQQCMDGPIGLVQVGEHAPHSPRK